MAIGAALVGGLVQSKAAKKATAAQTAAANQDIAFQKETRDLIRSDIAPWLQGGTLAQNALLYNFGLGSAPMVGGTAPAIETYNIPGQPIQPRPGQGNNSPFGSSPGAQTGPGTTGYRVNGQTFATLQDAQAYAKANPTGGTAYEGYTKTPGYDFRMNAGLSAIEASKAAQGGLYSGAAMRDALKFGQDYGTAEYGNHLAGLSQLAGSGQNAAAMSGQASQAAAGGVSNALAGIGNAQSAGAIAQGNAWNTAIGNGLGAWNYQKNMAPAGGSAGSGWNWLFGGSGLGGMV